MSIDTEHTIPATLSQFAAFGIVSKSRNIFSNLYRNNNVLVYHSPSEYTQSVKGQGRQHWTVPWAVGTGAQKRPERSVEVLAMFRVVVSSIETLHPAVPSNFDSCRKGAVQAPRSSVVFAMV